MEFFQKKKKFLHHVSRLICTSQLFCFISPRDPLVEKLLGQSTTWNVVQDLMFPPPVPSTSQPKVKSNRVGCQNCSNHLLFHLPHFRFFLSFTASSSCFASPGTWQGLRHCSAPTKRRTRNTLTKESENPLGHTFWGDLLRCWCCLTLVFFRTRTASLACQSCGAKCWLSSRLSCTWFLLLVPSRASTANSSWSRRASRP